MLLASSHSHFWGDKMAVQIEVNFTLAEELVRKLRDRARRSGVSEETLVEHALGLLFELEETPLNDYWFSIASMHEDWEGMPEDWMAAEVNNGVSTR